MSFPCGASQEAERTITDYGTPESRSKQAFKVKDVMPASLCPIHSSRHSKPAGNLPSRLRRDGTKLWQTPDDKRRLFGHVTKPIKGQENNAAVW